MSLEDLIRSSERGGVLLPRLLAFLENEAAKVAAGKQTRKHTAIHDAKLSVECFKERQKDYESESEESLHGEFFSPSSLGRCIREVWFQAFNAPEDAKGAVKGKYERDTLRDYLTFETGTYVGVMFQNLCEMAGVLECREYPIVNVRLKIKGHGDGVVNIGGRRLLEIKTINSGGFARLRGPKEGHVKQMTAYMKAGKLTALPGIIVYLDKDRHGYKEYLVPFDEKFYKDQVERRINSYFLAVRTKIPPLMEGDSVSAPPCMFCAFTRVCRETRQLANFRKTLQ